MKHLIAPSILAADFGKIDEEVEMLNQSDADWVHVDVMDGSFVPNISFGFPVIKAIKKKSKLPLDVHLMIDAPERYLKSFKEVGAEVLTVHYEACTHLHRTIQQIKELGMKTGVALNPHTNVDLLSDVIEELDLVCLMSVNPGFGGQKFIYNTLPKTKKLKALIETRNAPTKIEIDGGVGLQNAEKLLQAGADVLVAGSAVFKAENPIETINKLKSIGKDIYMV
jgi:ribulose-phosphate 3-epimerase